MASSGFLFLLFLVYFPDISFGGPVAVEFLYPNYTGSYLNFIDDSGVFLKSRNASFLASIRSLQTQQQFYLCVVHVPTTTIVWSANRNAPISDSGVFSFSAAGISVSLPANTTPVWSTPPLAAPAAALRLLDTGNLVLLDRTNATLWQSFDHPTDTILSGQTLHVGAALVSSASASNLSDGDYRLLVTPDDLLLRWRDGDQRYWSFSSDARAVKDTNSGVTSMAMNGSGLYLFGDGNGVVVWRTTSLQAAGFRIGKLNPKGRFTILSYPSVSSTTYVEEEFDAPSDNCQLPFPCSSLGLCTLDSNSTVCSCPPGFAQPPAGGCVPSDGSAVASASSCANSTSYRNLGSGVGYFAIRFATPAATSVDVTACRALCSGNCSCLGFYYRNSSGGACYFLENRLGSVILTQSDDGTTGFIKVVPGTTQPSDPGGGGGSKANDSATNLVPIVLPSIAVFLLVMLLLVLFLRWQRRRRRKKSTNEIKLGRRRSWRSARSEEDADEDDDEISIPGLPTRFTYDELDVATDGFQTRIGSGGFGEVFKGVLPDKTTVAVKRISNIGVQGKREFCTEIAVIGNIHHINLVKLRGFCAQGRKRLLVYEYMNRGSLERSLFAAGGSPALEWGERVEIALGTARGLAYLHGGCDNKIIHCDVKPENILLHDHSQVKISDFGLSKLLAPEQSALFTTMRGTRGYLAPEWLTNSAISDRTDVYSFGMVLLELVRGRKNYAVGSAAAASSSSTASALAGGSSSSPAAEYFPLHALEMHEQGRYIELADPRLEGRVEAEEVGKVVRTALCCLHEDPSLRPSMAAVVGMLEGTIAVWSPRVECLNFLRFYGRAFTAEPGRLLAAMGLTAAGGEVVATGNQGLYLRGNYTASGTTSGSTTSASPSYLSSHQLSGPR